MQCGPTQLRPGRQSARRLLWRPPGACAVRPPEPEPQRGGAWDASGLRGLGPPRCPTTPPGSCCWEPSCLCPEHDVLAAGGVAEPRAGIRVALIVVVEGRLHHCCLECRSQRGGCQRCGGRRHTKLFDRKCSRISERGWDPHRCVGGLRPPIIKKMVDRLDDACSLHRATVPRICGTWYDYVGASHPSAYRPAILLGRLDQQRGDCRP